MFLVLVDSYKINIVIFDFKVVVNRTKFSTV